MRILTIDKEKRRLNFDGVETNIGWTKKTFAPANIQVFKDKAAHDALREMLKPEYISAMIAELNDLYALTDVEKTMALEILGECDFK